MSTDTDDTNREFDDLPKGNAFADVVEEMQACGASWNQIHDAMAPVYDTVDHNAFEESKRDIPEWEATVIVPDHKATSGERRETIDIGAAETEADARERAANRHDVRRVENVEQCGTVTVVD